MDLRRRRRRRRAAAPGLGPSCRPAGISSRRRRLAMLAHPTAPRDGAGIVRIHAIAAAAATGRGGRGGRRRAAHVAGRALQQRPVSLRAAPRPVIGSARPATARRRRPGALPRKWRFYPIHCARRVPRGRGKSLRPRPRPRPSNVSASARPRARATDQGCLTAGRRGMDAGPGRSSSVPV